MKLANVNGRASIIHAGRALDIADASGGELSSDPMLYSSLAAHGELRGLLEASDGATGVRDFELRDLRPPVPRPSNILAVALNYRSHADETGRTVGAEPTVFAKLPGSLCGPYDPIEIAKEWTHVDYEAEVVIVIGSRLRSAHPDDVWSAIAGVTVGQDISDRAEQNREPLRQFSFAKSYESFAPIGPFLTTVDEFSDPDDIPLTARIDDAEVQRGSTTQLITSVPDLVAWISERVALEPGDLIFTGTPAGVGSRRTPPLYLRPGMVVETEIPQVGVMRNPVQERRHETTTITNNKELSA